MHYLPVLLNDWKTNSEHIMQNTRKLRLEVKLWQILKLSNYFFQL